MENKRTYFKFAGIFLVIIAVVLGGYYTWDYFFNEQSKIERQQRKQLEAYQKWEQNYIDAMTADTYGGKTPQETLDMFIEALRAENIELASKYFMLNTNENSEYYLTRKNIEEALLKAKEEKRLKEIIDILLQAVPDIEAAITENYFVFSVRNDNGEVITDIDLSFNKYSSVWKIQSL